MKHQVIIIHGGDSFNTYEEFLRFLSDWRIDFEDYRSDRKDWKDSLKGNLGEEFEIIRPSMPNKLNAKYLEWKIWFDKFVPYLEPKFILIGHSLGGLFLAKYLSENKLPQKAEAVFLVAPAGSEGDFILPNNLEKIEAQTDKIFLYQSEDDRVVPFKTLEIYKSKLKEPIIRIFQDRGHFNQKNLPEIVEDIRNLHLTYK